DVFCGPVELHPRGDELDDLRARARVIEHSCRLLLQAVSCELVLSGGVEERVVRHRVPEEVRQAARELVLADGEEPGGQAILRLTLLVDVDKRRRLEDDSREDVDAVGERKALARGGESSGEPGDLARRERVAKS